MSKNKYTPGTKKYWDEEYRLRTGDVQEEELKRSKEEELKRFLENNIRSLKIQEYQKSENSTEYLLSHSFALLERMHSDIRHIKSDILHIRICFVLAFLLFLLVGFTVYIK